ncbi:cation transport protein ChaC [Microvirga lupini]|uniref:glutathione-specific gamma-glutamylcyclotransferase n=1 Tax=Microvirga lupini TaxID=420324 RepID=A0A7W4YZ66_9HYPH|nr:gamma-glutamylcyclotransferase [Microvirga lupini]MBB3021019.1 cation transport protein ChaC [Microvirga lupini]
MRSRQMALTCDHVARVHRALEDPGPEPGLVYHSDDEYDAIVETILATHPAGEDAWLFAYGSLIWKPEVEHVEARRGRAHGWHRSFCFRITRFRATKDQPGLMMALDRGGQCRGILYRLPGQSLQAQLGKLFRREFTAKPANSMPRWITVMTDEGPVTALAFVMNRQSSAYVGRLTLNDVADVLAKACGHWGSGAEYLHNTVMHLEEHGIHDSNLWRLQRLVAAKIEEAEGR